MFLKYILFGIKIGGSKLKLKIKKNGIIIYFYIY